MRLTISIILLLTVSAVAQVAGPLSVSTVNPRLLVDPQGKPHYLAGSHTWSDVQNASTTQGVYTGAATFNFNNYVNFLVANNMNYTSLWVWMMATQQSGADSSSITFIQDFPWNRSGGSNANDGLPQFDFTSLNANYFNRLRSEAISLNQAGIYANAMLFNGDEFQFNIAANDGNPFESTNNINGINCAGMCPQHVTTSNAVWTTVEKPYIDHIVDTVGDLPNIIYEVSNEAETSGPTCSSDGQTTACNTIPWQQAVIAEIAAEETVKGFAHHPTMMTVSGFNGNFSASDSAIWNSTDTIAAVGSLDTGAGGIYVGNNAATGQCPSVTGNGGPANTSSPNCKINFPDTDHDYFYTELVAANDATRRAWAWENFMGENGMIAFMDPYLVQWTSRNSPGGTCNLGFCTTVDASYNPFRLVLGDTVIYGNKVDLINMIPQGSLSSGGFALSSAGVSGVSAAKTQYLVYNPTNTFTINTGAVSGLTVAYEVFNPATHAITASGSFVATSSTSVGSGQTVPVSFTGDVVVWLSVPATSGSGVPVLTFSDLTQGPATGNSDTSQGQTINANGAIVSVWGLNLGSAQGTSTLTIGGHAPSAIYYWGNAVRPWSPANLNNGYQNLQLIIFQVPAAADSSGIRVTVGGQSSNVLPFTIAAGRIFFAASGGGGAGTFQSPYANMVNLRNAMTNSGDIGYVENGTPVGTDGNCVGVAALCLYVNGLSLIGYPGALSTIGSTGTPNIPNNGGNGIALSNSSGSIHPNNTTVAKFDLKAGDVVINSKGDNNRWVASTVTAPNMNDGGGSGGIYVNGSNIYFLGLEIFQVGLLCQNEGGQGQCGVSGFPADTRTFNHLFYSTAPRATNTPIVQSNRQYLWNYIHDGLNGVSMGIHNFQDEGENGSFCCADVISDFTVAHNVVKDQYHVGINFSGVTGTIYVYDNLLINTGQGTGTANFPPGCTTNCTTWANTDVYVPGKFNAMNFGGPLPCANMGTLPSTYCQPANYHVFNNTVYGVGCPPDVNGYWCGYCDPAITTPGAGCPGSRLSASTSGCYFFFNTMDFHNNICIPNNSIIPYVYTANNPILPSGAAQSSNNLWFGSGTPPSFDTSPVNFDPQFISPVTGKFNLQFTSPAIGKGSSGGSTFVTYDLVGTPQPTTNGSWDIGAYSGGLLQQGWTQIGNNTNNALIPAHESNNSANPLVCPGPPYDSSIYGPWLNSEGCSAVIGAYSGATMNTDTNHLLVWGGGHADYGGNEIYDLNFTVTPPVWHRITGPTLPGASASANNPAPGCNTGTNNNSGGVANTLPALPGCVGGDQAPTSTHSVGGETYIPINADASGANHSEFFDFGGSRNSGSGGGDNRGWIYDLTSNTGIWSDLGNLQNATDNLSNVAQWDSVDNVVYLVPTSSMTAYNPSPTTTATRTGNCGTKCNIAPRTVVGIGGLGQTSTAINGAIDPVHRQMILAWKNGVDIGGFNIDQVDLATGTTVFSGGTQRATSLPGCPINVGQAPLTDGTCGMGHAACMYASSLTWDSSLNKMAIRVWPGDNDVFLYDTVAHSCTHETWTCNSSDCPSNTETGASVIVPHGGSYGKFQYWAPGGYYVFVGNGQQAPFILCRSAGGCIQGGGATFSGSAPVGSPAFSANPNPANLGNVNLGSSGAPTNIFITNTGTANLTTGTLTVIGTNPEDFAISSGCNNQTIAPNSNCAFTVTFTPLVSGARTATVNVPDNVHNPDTITINGTGKVAPPGSVIATPGY